MQLHNIKKDSGKVDAKVRVGRGGKRGKTCGHGHKGQMQHGRHGVRPEMRDFIKSLPKLRGFGKNRAKTVNGSKVEAQIVNLSTLTMFKAGEVISPETLVAAGVLKRSGNKLPKVKILSNGEVKDKLIIESCLISKQAKEAVEKAGGEVK